MNNNTKPKILASSKLYLWCLPLLLLGFLNTKVEALPADIEIINHLEKFTTKGAGERLQAIKALKIMGSKAIPALTAALEDESPALRGGAAFTLGSMGSQAESAIPSLIAVLADEDDGVRMDATVALRRIGEPAVDYLLEALKNNQIKVKRGAAFALAGVTLNKDEAVSALMTALADEDEQVRLNSAIALRALGERAKPQLQIALQNSDLKVRTAAALALGKTTTAKTVTPLTKQLENQSSSNRLWAAKILEKVGSETPKIASNAPGGSTPRPSPCRPRSCSAMPQVSPQQNPPKVNPQTNPNMSDFLQNPCAFHPNFNCSPRPCSPR